MSAMLLTLGGLLLVAGLLALIGPERLWLALPGPADLGPTRFETLTRRDSPNEALIAPPDLVTARVDAPAPYWPIPPDALARAVERAIQAQPRVTRLDDGADPFRLRYRQLTPLMRFPDVIDVQILPAAEGGSTIALHSRSALGYSDLGANAARARAWVEAIRDAAQQM